MASADIQIIQQMIDGLSDQDKQKIAQYIRHSMDTMLVDETISKEQDLTPDFPTPSQLLAMPVAERQKWIERSFQLASAEEFETFEAFGEEIFVVINN